MPKMPAMDPTTATARVAAVKTNSIYTTTDSCQAKAGHNMLTFASRIRTVAHPNKLITLIVQLNVDVVLQQHTALEIFTDVTANATQRSVGMNGQLKTMSLSQRNMLM